MQTIFSKEELKVLLNALEFYFTNYPAQNDEFLTDEERDEMDVIATLLAFLSL